MIVVKDLSKVFRTEELETSALSKVNIHIKRGEFVTIMGPSGCGKSTLLNLIGLLDKPTEGQYIFNSINLSKENEKNLTQYRKGNIGFIFQNFNLIDELNVFENVELPLVYMGISASKRKIDVDKVLTRMNISHRAKHYPQQLSGGQQQRVAIARAVVTQPKLILADEPTGNLDSKNGEEVMQLLYELNMEGTTIVMVTHSFKDSEYAQRIIHLCDGKIVSENNKISQNREAIALNE
ncbi:putative ABC transport system ATP-binding protein [Ancylomarina subtilis]|uniref:Putative ABC transport system ATP-binding protein n=1 Tax=Ancylomarina subtilis TaxID=1639035 RepID=A0A4Q7V852_9BACT|nr:ABC transporter ATP-binding protein [Ancylomarina subtilis]RZT91797.1 putative ABC transport system ATP-binding protein [Ancylomarina subtilis]